MGNTTIEWTTRYIGELLDLLDGQSRKVIEFRYGFQGEPLSLNSIARRLNPPTTVMTVKRIEQKALEFLRQTAATRGLVAI